MPETEAYLSDYVVYGPLPSGCKEPLVSIKLTGEEIHLLEDPRKWPSALYQKHRMDLLFLFREQFIGRELDSHLLREAVCVCTDITDCPFKKVPSHREERTCIYYVYGMCVSATLWTNQERTLSMHVLGLLRGITRQRVNQVLKRDYRYLADLLMENPHIREILEDIYQNKDLSAEEIIAKIMGAPEGISTQDEGIDLVSSEAPPDVDEA